MVISTLTVVKAVTPVTAIPLVLSTRPAKQKRANAFADPVLQEKPVTSACRNITGFRKKVAKNVIVIQRYALIHDLQPNFDYEICLTVVDNQFDYCLKLNTHYTQKVPKIQSSEFSKKDFSIKYNSLGARFLYFLKSCPIFDGTAFIFIYKMQ